MRRSRVRSATPITTTRRRRPPATHATSRTSPEPPTRITSRLVSQPTAPSAIPPAAGVPRLSITTTHRSRSPAHIRRLPAPHVTSTTITRRCPPIATAATRQTGTEPIIRRTLLRVSQLLAKPAIRTTSWAGATFNHNNTPFPLTGAHVSVGCNQCHINNVFAGTPTDCYSCHKADFTGTTNPNHVTAGWPTTCTTCHTTTAWMPATLPASYHTFFPLNHGSANGVCATCHTNSSDYSVFTCTSCHSASATTPRHSGVSGYVYNSVNCYACHKNGGGG